MKLTKSPAFADSLLPAIVGRACVADLYTLANERTDLAWARTGLAFFTNGALLLLRPELIAPTPLHRTVAGLTFALALFAVLMAC